MQEGLRHQGRSGDYEGREREPTVGMARNRLLRNDLVVARTKRQEGAVWLNTATGSAGDFGGTWQGPQRSEDTEPTDRRHGARRPRRNNTEILTSRRVGRPTF